MPNITIKEILAADSVSEAVDKINFNFDQLLLNGGGPVGPIGGIGEIGPLGPRGTIWFTVADLFTTPASPMWTGTPERVNDINALNYPQFRGDPNKFLPVGLGGVIEATLVFGNINKLLRDGDLYIQESDDILNSFSSLDGDIWEFDSISQSWLYTGVNIKGESGQSGSSGFSQWSRFTDTSTDILYPTQVTGQDIPKIVIGEGSNIEDFYNPLSSLTISSSILHISLGNPLLHNISNNSILDSGNITMTSDGALLLQGSNTSEPADTKEIIIRSFSDMFLLSGDASDPIPTQYNQLYSQSEHRFIGGRLTVRGGATDNVIHQLLNSEISETGINFILKPTGTTLIHIITTDLLHDLVLQNTIGKVGIGQFTGIIGSKLSVDGNVSIGSGYKSITTGPTNGLIVEGNSAIGNSSNTTSRFLVNAAISLSQIAQEIINNRDAAAANGLKINILRSVNDAYALNVQVNNQSTLFVSGNRNIGILTDNPTHTITFNGEANRTIKVANRTAPNLPGNDLILEAGGVISGTNLKGGNVIISTGSSTGISGSSGAHIDFLTSGAISGSNNTPREPEIRVRINKNGDTGFGTTSPTTKVDIDSGVGTGLRIRGGTPTSGDVLVAQDVDGNTQWSRAGVPTGAIIMWGGRLDSIPSGWQLCDGTSAQGALSTQLLAQGSPFGSASVGQNLFPAVPNLTEKFIVGARNEVSTTPVFGSLPPHGVGDTGGSNVVTLSAIQIPAHVHGPGTLNITSSGNHTHQYSGGGSITRANGGSNTGGEPATKNTTGTGAHVHGSASFAGATANNTPNGGSHENRPPYFALCFIIKNA